jgi:hypothetical protein
MSKRNFDRLVFVGAMTVIIGISFGAAWHTHPTTRRPKGQTDTNTQKTGEKGMLTATNQKGEVHHADETNWSRLPCRRRQAAVW